jgi:hypothetical protein
LPSNGAKIQAKEGGRSRIETEMRRKSEQNERREGKRLVKIRVGGVMM